MAVPSSQTSSGAHSASSTSGWLQRPSGGLLEGHPAFILGNGPALPEDLSGLADFFTVGVNRILERLDPTFIMWLDADVTPLVEPRLADAQAVPLVRDEVCSGPWLSLTPAHTLQGPTTYIDCKNSGVSAGASK